MYIENQNKSYSPFVPNDSYVVRRMRSKLIKKKFYDHLLRGNTLFWNVLFHAEHFRKWRVSGTNIRKLSKIERKYEDPSMCRPPKQVLDVQLLVFTPAITTHFIFHRIILLRRPIKYKTH